MTTLQKVIKYCAIGFAIFLIVNIISAIIFGIRFVGNIVIDEADDYVRTESLEKIAMDISDEEITALELEMGYTNLQIKEGECFEIETNNPNISWNQKNGKLQIKEKGVSIFEIHNTKDTTEVVISIPTSISLSDVELDAGAGKIEIESLKTQELSLDLGAGKVEIQELQVTGQAEIDGGAGKTEILSGTIHNLDLDLGVGEFVLHATLTGRNDIDAGVGSVKIDLTDELENYAIRAEKGIGSITLDGKEMSDDIQYGNGDSYLDIDGGVGSIEIK